jgi:hypothetical protein
MILEIQAIHLSYSTFLAFSCVSIEYTYRKSSCQAEPEFLNFKGAQESISPWRNRFLGCRTVLTLPISSVYPLHYQNLTVIKNNL